jgi:hypothetical protein
VHTMWKRRAAEPQQAAHDGNLRRPEPKYAETNGSGGGHGRGRMGRRRFREGSNAHGQGGWWARRVPRVGRYGVGDKNITFLAEMLSKL